MSATVILTATHGDLPEQEYVFDEPAQCVVGRASDCTILVPLDIDRSFVSRHHCVLDIQPPEVRVRDLGSLNGTYVNGAKIGQRPRHKLAEEADPDSFPELALQKGDEVRVGLTVLRVEIQEEAIAS